MPPADKNRTKFLLDEKDIPTKWYNIQADLKSPLPPVLHPPGQGFRLRAEAPEEIAAHGAADGAAGVLGDQEAVELAVGPPFLR